MNHFNYVVNCCKDLLVNYEDAKDVKEYANSRLSPEGQEKYEFGYFPRYEDLDILISCVGKEKLIALELIYNKIISGKKEIHSHMEKHNLIMPYKDVYGNIIAIVGRSILSDEEREVHKISKYKNTSFTKGNHLFGLYEAKNSIIKNNLAIVVEGQFDCISAHINGLMNVVALGTSSMTFDQFCLLLRYTNNMILLLDEDKAGSAGTDKIIRLFSKYANIKKASLPKGYKDIDVYLSENDVKSLNFLL